MSEDETTGPLKTNAEETPPADATTGADLAGAPPPEPPPPLIEDYPIDAYSATRPGQQRSYRRSSCLSVLLLLSALVLLALFFLAPSATVILVPDRQPVSEDVLVKAGPGIRAMDVEARQIQARVVGTEVSGSGQLSLKKTKDVITGRAQGTVTFANKCDQSVPVPKGTIVRTANGSAEYETTEEILVPGTVFGTAKVAVKARVEGPAGNTEKCTITVIAGTLGGLLYVANDAPIAGGERKTVTYVTTEDRANLRETVLAKLKEEAYPKLRGQVNKEGEFVPPESVRVEKVIEETYDKAVNEEATVINLTMKVSFAATAIEGQKANELATLVLDKKVKTGFQIIPQSVQLGPKGVERVDGDTVLFRMQAQATSIAAFDEGRICRDLKGKTLAEAKQYLASLPNQAEPPRIEVFPGWWERISPLEFRCYIHVAPKSGP